MSEKMVNSSNLDPVLTEEFRRIFAERLVNEVKLTFVDWSGRCAYGQVVKDLLAEIASLSDKIRIETYDVAKDESIIEELGITKVPGVIISGKEDYGIGFFGTPSGYQLRALLEAMIDVSRGDSGLSEEAKRVATSIVETTYLQLFVTSNCRYCYEVTRTICKLAIENDKVIVDVTMAEEFRDLAVKYQVTRVPKLIINERNYVVGAPSEEKLVELIAKYTNTKYLESIEDPDRRSCSV